MVVFAAACQVDARVGIEVAEDGSGTVEVVVTLDRTAAERLGDPATALRLDDLREAGWETDEPSRPDGGGLVVVVRRPFAAPDQLAGVLDEIGGTDGIFRETELSISDSFSSTTYEFRSSVELTGSLEQFSDAELAAALDGLPLARSAEELAAEGATEPDAATLRVDVQLPGATPETNGEVVDGAATWDFSATSGTATSERLESTSSTSGGPTVLLAGVAGIAAIAAVALLVVGLLGRRR